MLKKLNLVRLFVQAVAVLWIVLVPLVVLKGLSGMWNEVWYSWQFILFLFATVYLSTTIGVIDIEWVDVDIDENGHVIEVEN